MNKAAARATGDWVLPLADDDLLLPGCLARLLAATSDEDGEYDVVYPRPLVWGEEAEAFWREPPDIPSLALIRADLWRSLGGYDETLGEREDNEMWRKVPSAGGRMVCYDAAPTWVYVFHGGNKSRHGGVAS